MSRKIISLQEAAALVHDGDILALGGNVLHRAPMAMVRELVRQRRRRLRLVKTAGAHDIDLLCAAGCVQSVDAGFVSYETEYGLAMHYRKAVERGEVQGHEHACYTVICALRAAASGVPFMPVAGLKAGDLIAANDYFEVIPNPFGDKPVTVVRSIVPDVAVLHVQECDEDGNAVILGPKFEDVLMSRAAKRVILTTEKIVPKSKMRMRPDSVDIPHFLVEAVVHAPRGAAPCSCEKSYEAGFKMLERFVKMKTTAEIEEYVQAYESKDRSGMKAGGQW
ncbi:CoA transferase subunit A [Paenibacillus thiaminolyticus]|uniref:CoA transferase subunit A n=1 Tax=Paenibacillus thiaminolyticus TaxID=49283 RepID=UPI00232ECF55|nr:CoA-transferase [Paenibacillus thiaminolyticus]WCF09329.1 CoA transferase subunit A [Paenibacillus thiaminolyticus]